MTRHAEGTITAESDAARELLREMVRLRTFDEAVGEQFEAGEIPGNPHLCFGHEGNHAAIGAAIRDDDWWVVGGARQDTQFVARGLTMDEVMAEIYGKVTGSNRGRGGPMHVSNVDENFYGHAATIGSPQNPAAGIALAQDMLDTGNVVVCTVGDGGTSRGSFHTALILAALWELPVVYVVENNQWAISVSRDLLPPAHLSDYGDPVGLHTESVDGSDPLAAYDAIRRAVDRAREGGGASVVESDLFRMAPHSGRDDEHYRDPAEKQRALEEGDPIENLKRELLDGGHLAESHYERMVEDAREEVRSAVTFAQESDWPEPAEIHDHVFVEPLYGQGGD